MPVPAARTETSRTLRSGFLRAAETAADRPALEVEGCTLTYGELRDRAVLAAATLDRAVEGEGAPLTAVFAHRSATAFSGVLAALFRGHGYVPLNPTFPVERTRAMLERSGCTALIVDRNAAPQLVEVLQGVDGARTLLLPDHEDVEDIAAALPGHRVLGAGDLARDDDWVPGEADPDGIAYLLFTSGSTGTPKGVMVAHRNVTHFVDVMVNRYDITSDDRFSQMFEMTFDLSVFDMFVAWERGACICCPSKKDAMLPTQFVNDSGITVWFAVPSSGVLLNKFRALQPGAFPALRVSLFCGEAFPAELARAWAAAAPNGVLENLYGPTELTIACTLYRWDAERSEAECELGLVPIGVPYDGMEVLVADASGRAVPPGETGELLMTGPQLTLGYWQDPERTAAAFVTPPGRAEVFYRTGDRVRRPVGDGPLVYLGRLDNQIKVHGYRVELGEVEAALREASGVEVAIAIGWPVVDGSAEGIHAFLQSDDADVAAVKAAVAERLPGYMVPRRIHRVVDMPLNSNGKVDRNALRARFLEQA